MPQDSDRIEALRREVAANPSSRQFYQLGELLRRDGQVEDAIMVLRQGLGSQTKYVAAWVSLGRALLQAEKYGQASDALREALSNDPGNPVAWRLLGEARHGSGEKEGALSAFERALDLAPGDDALQLTVDGLREELRDSLFDAGEQRPVIILRDEPDEVPEVPEVALEVAPPAPEPMDATESGADADEPHAAWTAEPEAAAAPDMLNDTSPFGRPAPMAAGTATALADEDDQKAEAPIQEEAGDEPKHSAEASSRIAPPADAFEDPFDLGSPTTEQGGEPADVFASQFAEPGFGEPAAEASSELAEAYEIESSVEPEAEAEVEVEPEPESIQDFEPATTATVEPWAAEEAVPVDHVAEEELDADEGEPADEPVSKEDEGPQEAAFDAATGGTAEDEEDAWSIGDTERIPVTEDESESGAEAVEDIPAEAIAEEPEAADGGSAAAIAGDAGAAALVRAAEPSEAPLPFTGPATVTMARLYIQQQQLDGAVATLERVLDREPVNQEARDLLDLVRDMMEPLPDTLPPLSVKERKIAALQRWLASLTLGHGRSER